MPLSSPARAVGPRTWHWSALFLTVTFSVSGLAAAGDSDTPSPDEVVITAARIPEVRSSVSQSIGVLNADEIAREAARTPNQMLSEQVGIWTPQTATQGSPIIRGQIGNRVLYLWDGIRINNGAIISGPSSFFNQFPIGSVERMEVLRGSGAVQYGSDAIGGVINIIGKQSDPFSAPAGLRSDLTTRHGTVDDELTLGGDVSYVGDRIAINGGLSHQNVGDYDAPGIGTMDNTGFRDLGGHAGVAFRLTESQQLKFGFVEDERTAIETYTQSKLNPVTHIPRIYGPFEKRWIGRTDYDLKDSGWLSQDFKVTAYLQQYSSDRLQTNEATKTLSVTRTHVDQRIYGLSAQNTASFGPVRLTLGAEGHTERLVSDKFLATKTFATGNIVNTIPNGSVPDGNYDVVSAFALANWNLTRDLELRLGTRFEQSHIDSDPVPSDALAPFTVSTLTLDKKWNAFTGSSGVVYHLTSRWSLAANFETAFRAPSYSDTLSTGVPVFASGIASVPSPGVGPERSRNSELSIRYEGQRAALVVTGYYSALTDLMTSQNTGTITIPGVGIVIAQSRTNSGSGFVRGFEAEAAVRIADHWEAFSNASYTYGQDTVAHVPLRFIPPFNGLAGMRFSTTHFWSEAVVRWADRLRRHSPQDELDAGFSRDPGLGSPNTTTNPPLRPDFSIPGFAVLNLRGGLRLDRGMYYPTQITVDLNNVTNKAYREAYSQQELVAPGFNALLTLEWRF